jgi:hypothetical protein
MFVKLAGWWCVLGLPTVYLSARVSEPRMHARAIHGFRRACYILRYIAARLRFAGGTKVKCLDVVEERATQRKGTMGRSLHL